MLDRTSLSMVMAVGVAQYPFQTATVHRGKEFACFRELEESHGMKVYLQICILHGSAAPISSWSR
ncbi:hypothetical protein J45TS6_35150 [Paenibacillus sp. J45TS6]|uniref:hypothetical protein n=1 Tax=Paenibacillus sp. J45TS6 TaxID=2807196 RepID=UPI001B11AAB0|nr:hypothetical protein [Paenibacillus sp. J45TS6]GIP45056.1 hypothetical protein J45TS6_35150 [Paenibacillus sp. J45TS6]